MVQITMADCAILDVTNRRQPENESAGFECDSLGHLSTFNLLLRLSQMHNIKCNRALRRDIVPIRIMSDGL